MDVKESGTIGSGPAWSMNTLLYLDSSLTPITIGGSNTSWVATGFECDVNNQSSFDFDRNTIYGVTSLGAAYGINISAGGVGRSSAALNIHGTPSAGVWFNGIEIQPGSVYYSSVVDGGDAYYCYAMEGSNYWGLDTTVASFVYGPIRLADGQQFRSVNGSDNVALFQYSGSIGPGGTVTATGGLLLAPPSNGYTTAVGNGGVQTLSDFLPAINNFFNCGNGNRVWASVWVHGGTVSGSSPELKTDIAALPPMLPIVARIEPRSFKWKTGGVDIIDVEREVLVPDEIVQEDISTKIEMRDGMAVEVRTVVNRGYPLSDEVPLFDEAGLPIMVQIPGTPASYDSDGSVVRPATPPTTRQKTGRVPRMTKKMMTVTERREHPGRRTHFGFLAPDFKSAFDTLGIDFGGYIRDPDGNEGLRPDQQIAILWKAVQELAEEVAKLRSQFSQ
jgi:hypothetical protein